MLKLYWYWSTNPQKIRWALEELELPYERIKIELGRGEHRKPAYLAINPRGTVPALIDGDLTVTESGAILSYLGDREGRLWPTTSDGRAKALQWLFYEAEALQPAAGRVWYHEYLTRKFGGERDEDLLGVGHRDLKGPLRRLDAHLKHSDWILDEFSLVDCAYGVWITALAGTSVKLTEPIQAYLVRCQARPAFQRTEIRYA